MHNMFSCMMHAMQVLRIQSFAVKKQHESVRFNGMETIPQSEFTSKHESSKSHCKTSCLQLRLTGPEAFTLLPLAVQFRSNFFSAAYN